MQVYTCIATICLSLVKPLCIKKGADMCNKAVGTLPAILFIILVSTPEIESPGLLFHRRSLSLLPAGQVFSAERTLLKTLNSWLIEF